MGLLEIFPSGLADSSGDFFRISVLKRIHEAHAMYSQDDGNHIQHKGLQGDESHCAEQCAARNQDHDDTNPVAARAMAEDVHSLPCP